MTHVGSSGRGLVHTVQVEVDAAGNSVLGSDALYLDHKFDGERGQ